MMMMLMISDGSDLSDLPLEDWDMSMPWETASRKTSTRQAAVTCFHGEAPAPERAASACMCREI